MIKQLLIFILKRSLKFTKSFNPLDATPNANANASQQ